MAPVRSLSCSNCLVWLSCQSRWGKVRAVGKAVALPMRQPLVALYTYSVAHYCNCTVTVPALSSVFAEQRHSCGTVQFGTVRYCTSPPSDDDSATASSGYSTYTQIHWPLTLQSPSLPCAAKARPSIPIFFFPLSLSRCLSFVLCPVLSYRRPVGCLSVRLSVRAHDKLHSLTLPFVGPVARVYISRLLHPSVHHWVYSHRPHHSLA
ncbi:hypothetical protein BCV70DRAFT_43037 [Testicularia cyperi]|uniref:Uncharacterized protein n=1 Tax=Testicularia cyperi TaxID=1882483 RepID=A0A317XIB2_9BASI|nr:hypothetical protein BCV70DRAFT_43037 [Testicularia cyperi]